MHFKGYFKPWITTLLRCNGGWNEPVYLQDFNKYCDPDRMLQLAHNTTLSRDFRLKMLWWAELLDIERLHPSFELMGYFNHIEDEEEK